MEVCGLGSLLHEMSDALPEQKQQMAGQLCPQGQLKQPSAAW